MVCSNCGTENRPGRKFCLRCGAPLAVVCPVCGTANEPESLFCGECGASLSATAAPAPSAAVGATVAPPPAVATQPRPGTGAERRLVSVLFADLVGFTPLSERRDAEEVRDLLTRYFDTCRELVARYGGTVEKFIGDAVMAAWGAPVAHEDDAERAVRAALDLVEAVAALGSSVGEPGLTARAAVLTGEAAVTLGAEGQGMVAGDLVNTASRLQSIAEPGTVLVGESTYLAARSAVAFDAAGELALKGKEAPVAAWQALRVTAGRRGTKWTDVLEPPFVGREDEFRLLKELFHATAREGRARLVSVMGIAGIGKSRLAWELFKYLDGTADVAYWHQGRSPAYGEGLAFWALAEMVRMRAHIVETEPSDSTRQKLAAAVEEFAADDEERRWILGALAHLLGLEEGPVWEREQLFAAWRTFFERIAERAPTVMVFEDLHWADPGLFDFIEHLLESSSRTRPMLIVSLARPELMDRRPTWGAGQRNFTSIHLEPLGVEDMTKLIRGLAPDLPLPLVERILERAEGVPLYAVETIRMLVDRGALVAEEAAFRVASPVGELDIPDSLHALIAARLDALGPADRALLQDGAVLGKSFTLNALAAVTGEPPEVLEPRLRSLVRKELLALDADPRSPERGQYGFVQSLIREVAYQTLSRKDRRLKHLAAAEHFERLADEELASIVATHFLEAYRAVPEGPDGEELAARARDALVAASDRAAELGSHGQSLSFLEQAIEVTKDHAIVAGLHEQAGEAALKAAMHEAARRLFEKAIELYEGNGDAAGSSRAKVGLGSVLLHTGHPDLAIEVLEPAAASFADPERDPAWIRLAAELARAYMFRGKEWMSKALEWAERVLVAAERQDMGAVVAEALSTKGAVLDFLGRGRESRAILRGALDLAREEGQVRAQLRTYYNLAFRLVSWRPRQGVEVAREGVAFARKLGLREWEVLLASAACVALHDLGEWEELEAILAEVWTDDLPETLRMDIGTMVALFHAERGEFDQARAVFERIRPLVEASTRANDRAMFAGIQGMALLPEGELEEAHRLLMIPVAEGAEWVATWGSYAARPAVWARDLDGVTSVLDGLEAIGVKGPWQRAGLAEVRAGVAVLQGRRDEARALYEEAARGWRDLGAQYMLAMTRLDAVLLLGADERTRAEADEARAIFTRLGARPFLERLEAAVSGARPA